MDCGDQSKVEPDSTSVTADVCSMFGHGTCQKATGSQGGLLVKNGKDWLSPQCRICCESNLSITLLDRLLQGSWCLAPKVACSGSCASICITLHIQSKYLHRKGATKWFWRDQWRASIHCSTAVEPRAAGTARSQGHTKTMMRQQPWIKWYPEVNNSLICVALFLFGHP